MPELTTRAPNRTPLESPSLSDPKAGGVAVDSSERHREHFSLHGLGVWLTTDHPEVRQAVSRILRYFGFLDAKAPAGSDPNPGQVETPLDLELLTRGESVEPSGPSVTAETYSGLEVRRSADGLVARGPGLSAFLEPSEGRGSARVTLDRWRAHGPMGEPEITFVLLCLMILMRRRGIYPMHAAALEWKHNGLLIVATGGAGKSTLTVGLVSAGWSPLSDDSILLRDDDGIEALALRRNLYLHPEAAVAFPDLADAWQACSLSESPKRFLAVDEVFPGQASTRCTPRLILFPTIVDQPISTLRPLPAAHALGKLIGQSFLVFLEPTRSAEQIDLLRRLVSRSQCFELLAGHDLKAHPEAAATLLAPLLTSPLKDTEHTSGSGRDTPGRNDG